MQYSRILSVFGSIPPWLTISMWFDLLHVLVVIFVQSLDLKYFWRDLQKLQNVIAISPMMVVNFLMLILEFFIALSVLGATYARQMVAYAEHGTNNVFKHDVQRLSDITADDIISTPLPNYYRSTSELGWNKFKSIEKCECSTWKGPFHHYIGDLS